MKRFVAFMVVLAGLLSLEVQVPAQSEGTASAIRIKLTVTAEASLKSNIVRQLTDALQSLPHVMLTDEEPAYRLDVFAAPVGTTSGIHTKDSAGVAFSVLIGQCFDTERMSAFVSQRADEATAEHAAAFGKGYIFLRGHWLEITAGEDLGQACKRIVATVNSRVLEPDRAQGH